MPNNLTFFHTSPVHVARFDRLLAALDVDVSVRHIVDETLLADAMAAGEITPSLAERVEQLIYQAFDDEAEVILCTCTTLGGCAEAVDPRVLRVDRPMAEKAVSLGDTIVVVATIASTSVPTRALLQTVAMEMGKTIEIIEVLCDTAWAKFEQGDQAGYLRDVAETLEQVAPQGGVIVLAQASMAEAVDLVSDLPVPVLNSPRLGVEAALNLLAAQLSEEET